MAAKLFELKFAPDIGEIRFALAEWADSIKDMAPIYRDIAMLFKNHEKRHLESEGATTGKRFPPLSKTDDGYGKWKKQHFPRARILERDGVLYRALVKGGGGSIQPEVTKERLQIGVDPNATLTRKAPFWWKGKKKDSGSSRPYALGRAALAHSTGITTKQGFVIPRRPPVRFNDSVTDRGAFGYAVQQIFQAHIVRERKKSPALRKAIEDKYGGIPKGSGPQKTIDAAINGQWE
tara:strand:- start:1501 stop:2205 length:705 start_codon:yes stop_codon:yes gene_type:complete